MSFYWKAESAKRLLYSGTECIGELSVNPSRGLQIIREQIDELEEGIYEIFHEYAVDDSKQSLGLTVDFTAFYSSNWSMIPALSYNGNNWGKGLEPKGFIKNGEPWIFSYSRTSIPGATYSEGDRWAVGLFAYMDSSIPPFSCSLIPQEECTIHRLIWPEQEKPLSYFQRDRYNGSFEKKINLEERDTFSIKIYLVVDKSSLKNTSYMKMLDFAWKINYYERKPWFTPEEIWDLGYSYAKNYLYVEDRIFKGFSKGLIWDGQEWKLRPTAKYLVGWTGQNLSLANSMIYSFVKTGNKTDLEMGLNTFESWVKHGRLENGLIRCLFDYVLGDDDESKEVQDACNLSEAALNFFEAWDILKRHNIEKSEYKDVALGICDFVIKNQSPNGGFGKSWKNNGKIDDPNGTIGCYLVAPLIKAYEITGDKKYLKAAKRGYDFYFASFLRDGYTSAAALDTYCIDKESAIPLLKSSLLLYEIEKDSSYIKNAELASYYLASWQWHYTIPFPKGTPLSDMQYDTFGGTSVSTQHHHIDPFAIVFVKDWLRLAELTGKEIWKQRARAAWINGTYGISDGNLLVNGVKRPVGSQDEGFYHTHWGAPWEETGSPKGNVSYWLVAWPTAFRLQLLRQLKDWKQL